MLRRICSILGAMALILAAVVCLAMALYGRRIVQWRTYTRVVFHDDFIKNLEPEPKEITIRNPEDSVPLDLGYGDVFLPSSWLRGVETNPQAVIILRGGNNEIITFMPLIFETQYSLDGNYTWAIRASRSAPVTSAKIFTMPEAEFNELMYYTLPKVSNRFNQNGIGLFETDYVRGIIRYGIAAKPGAVNIEVWSKKGNVSQGILIRTQDAESSSRLIQSVLSNLKYSINTIPTKQVLLESIRETFKEHPLLDAKPNG